MKIINSAADCSIKTFIDARFDGKVERLIIDTAPMDNKLEQHVLSEVLLQAIIEIETEFNDLCGIIPPELTQMNKVNKMIARNKAVELHFFVIDELVRKVFDLLPASAVEQSGEYLHRPKAMVVETLEKLKKFGISLKWNSDINQFKKAIATAKSYEKVKHVQLKEAEKELETMQLKATKGQPMTKKGFYHLIHAVQNIGYKISEHETNMYSFGVACGDMFELQKKQSPN